MAGGFPASAQQAAPTHGGSKLPHSTVDAARDLIPAPPIPGRG